MMMSFLILSVVCCAIVLYILNFVFYLLVKYDSCKDDIPIKYKQFVALYNVAKSKWCLDDQSVYYNHDYHFYFNTFIDFLRYKHFARKQHKLTTKKYKLNKKIEVQKYFLKDIQKYKEETEQIIREVENNESIR